MHHTPVRADARHQGLRLPFRLVTLLLAALLLVWFVPALSACTNGNAGDGTTEGAGSTSPEAAQDSDNGAAEDDPGQGADDADADSSGTEVLMLGRSVMAGWFDHWGWDGESVSREGFVLRYGELAGPPDIADSACAYIADAPPGSIVFFKFCFVDFSAGDRETADAELAEREEQARRVAECAATRPVTLVFGNALPQTASQSNPVLVDEHRRFDEWLREFANENGAFVVDLNSELTDGAGSLRAEFASGPDDAHLTDVAYEALDEALFPVLREAAAARN